MEFQRQSRPQPETLWRTEIPRTAPRPALGSSVYDFLFLVLGPIFINFWVDVGMAWEGLCKMFFSFLALSVPCQTRSDTPWRPKRAQNRTKTPVLAHLGHLCATSCQEAPNLKPTSAKMGQLVAKIAGNSSPSNSRPHPHPSKTKQK